MLARKIKEKLKRGEVSCGGWMSIGNETIAEIFALSGYDWVLVETEHTAIDNSETLRMLMAIEGRGCVSMVRLAGIDPIQAKALLDSGAGGVLVPMVNSKEDAEKCVGMTKYPPLGERGVGLARAHNYGKNFSEYVATANDDLLLMLQIEHIDAVNNIEEIVSVPGIDGTYIGPYDLSMSMGLPGQIDHPDVIAAMDKVLKATLDKGLVPGIHLLHTDTAAGKIAEYTEKGYLFYALGSDLVILSECTEKLVKGCEQALIRNR